jgi:hypothetical protein
VPTGEIVARLPAPPPEPEQEEEEPLSLAKILLEKLRDDSPCSFTEEEHQQIFHQAHPNFPGYPEMPPPAGFLREGDKTEKPG